LEVQYDSRVAGSQNEGEVRSRSSWRVSSFPGILIVTVSLPLLALGLWQLFLSSCTRTYTWASTCPGPVRRALSGGDSISKGMSFAKARGSTKYIYQYMCLREPTLSIPVRIRIAHGSLSRESRLAKPPRYLAQVHTCHFPKSAEEHRLRNLLRRQPVLP